MAVKRTSAQGATATNVRTGKSRIDRIELYTQAAMANAVYLQLFDSNSPTVGSTAPNDVISIVAPPSSSMLGQTIKQKQMLKVIFGSAYGGKRYGTGLSFAVTTTFNGSTDPGAADKPDVKVFYEPVT